MANRNTVGFGLIPTGTVGSTPATAGQGKYFIDAAYDVSLFQGSVVQSKVGYIKDAESSRTANTIGILNGIFYNAATTLKPTFDNKYIQPITPANSEDIVAFVIDNPMQLFVGMLDAAAAQAEFGKTVSMSQAIPSGSTTSGQSNKKLDDTNIHVTNNQFRLLRSAEDPENDENAANRSVVVCQNLNQYLTNAVTWQ
tara:strand:+ start:106 stop:696 length:591 start_codon:yes stop_codon:yes gene_type:complete